MNSINVLNNKEISFISGGLTDSVCGELIFIGIIYASGLMAAGGVILYNRFCAARKVVRMVKKRQ